MNWLFASGGQSIGASVLASVLPMNIQGWFPLGLTGLISLLSKGLSRVFSNTMIWKHWLFSTQLSIWFNSKTLILHYSAFFMVQLSHPYMTTGESTALIIWTFVNKVIPLLFNMLSRLVIAFLPRSKHLLIARLQSPSKVILEPRKIKYVTIFTFSPSFCY